MTDAVSVSYKVYLEDGSDVGEIRRFGIDRILAFKFNFLKEKLKSVFPALQNKSFDVYWKDGEGDSVMISSDEELTIALSEMGGELRKIFVVTKTEEAFATGIEIHNDSSPPLDGPPVHEGITCDGCGKIVTGFRYKCIVCPDFDLCNTCESFGVHEEHFMIRISKPVKWRPTYSRRLAHHMAKWSRQGDAQRQHHQRRGSNVKFTSGLQMGGNSGNCPYRGYQMGHPGPGWLEYLCSQLGEWVNLPGEAEMPSGPEGPTTATPGSASAPESAAKPTPTWNPQTAQGPQVAGPSGNSEKHRDMNYLQNVGETVAAVLKPFGIDVEIRATEKKPNQTEGKQKPSQETGKREAGKAPEATAASEPMDITQETPSAPPEHESADSEEWTVLSENVASGTQSSGPDNGDGKSRIDNLTPEMMEELARAKALYPTMEDVLERTRQLELESLPITEPKIRETTQRLMAMGFTNEGGWLAQLVRIKDGDIEKVLDVLLHTRK